MANRYVPLERRFAMGLSVGHPGGCWRWVGSRNRNGYGAISVGGRNVGVHRVAYELFVGPIPPSHEPDHLCRVRDCVNPEHLEPVTHRENMRRGTSPAAANARKRACPSDHPYDEANTYRDPSGRRHCRACQSASFAASRVYD